MTGRPMRVLLTGATGFIGGRLLPALDAAGYSVRCLVRTGETLVVRQPLARPPEVVTADLLAASSLPAALTGMDAAICAALAQTAAGPGKLPSRQACFLDR